MSLKEESIPVCDTCTYFFVYNSPVNAACIDGGKPMYDENNKYIQQSIQEYELICKKFGEDGVLSFIDNICSLGACGRVSGMDMLRCIHRYSQKRDRSRAIAKYKSYMSNLKHTHIIKDEDGKPIRVECSKYVAHNDIVKGLPTEPKVHVGSEFITKQS